MNLMMMLGMLVSVSLCMFTVPNALLMSKATATVHYGGLGLLKSVVCGNVVVFIWFWNGDGCVKDGILC